jgi:hypothetical protein
MTLHASKPLPPIPEESIQNFASVGKQFPTIPPLGSPSQDGSFPQILGVSTTIPFKDNGTDTLITVNTLNNAPLTPFTLLDMWLKDLKDAGYVKFSAKAVFIEPFELLSRLKSTFKQAVPQ